MDFLVRARWWVAAPDDVIEHGAARIRDGRVSALYRTASALRRAPQKLPLLDFGDAIVAPGLINAHAHLELSGLRELLPRGADFARWIRTLMLLRAAKSHAQLEADARLGADRALATGTTMIADIDSSGAAVSGLSQHAARIVHLREVLDAWHPERTASALSRVRRKPASDERRIEGLSPHASFTASTALLREVARLALARRAPVQMHWSETSAELDWLTHGAGPLAGLLGRSPRRTGLAVMRAAGLLRTRLSLVHGNFPMRGEPGELARRGVTVVHCPGSHVWFERDPFPWARYANAGVPIALGTDSWASNDDLDLRREMRLTAAAFPQLALRSVWSAGTLAGARWLRREGEFGVLTEGAHADWLVLPVAARSQHEVFECLVRSTERVEQTWIAGRCVHPRPHPANSPETSGSTVRAAKPSQATQARGSRSSARRAASPARGSSGRPSRARSNRAPARSKR